MKLKKGINPIGTFQLIRMQLAGGYTWHKYKVIEVTGDDTNAPNQDGPTIWFELVEKNGGNLQQFFALPLSAFGVGKAEQRVMPLEGTDKFWDEGKVVAA